MEIGDIILVACIGLGTEEDSRRPDLPYGVSYEVIEDHGTEFLVKIVSQ